MSHLCRITCLKYNYLTAYRTSTSAPRLSSLPHTRTPALLSNSANSQPVLSQFKQLFSNLSNPYRNYLYNIQQPLNSPFPLSEPKKQSQKLFVYPRKSLFISTLLYFYKSRNQQYKPTSLMYQQKQLPLRARVLLRLFIIFKMQKVVAETGRKEGNAMGEQPSDRERVVEVKRKIGILKEGLLGERQGNRHLEQRLYEQTERLKKMQLDSKKREEKNEALLLEIRSLKDALIAERNEKQQAAQHLAQLQAQEKAGGEGKKGLSSMFGLKSLFQ